MTATGRAASTLRTPPAASVPGQPSRPLPSARTCVCRTVLCAVVDRGPRTGNLRAGRVGGKRRADSSPAVRGSRGSAPWPPSSDPDSGSAGGGVRLAPQVPPLRVLTHLGRTASAPFVKENCSAGRSTLTGHCCPDAAFRRSPSLLPSALARGHRRPAPQEAWHKFPPPSAFLHCLTPVLSRSPIHLPSPIIGLLLCHFLSTTLNLPLCVTVS